MPARFMAASMVTSVRARASLDMDASCGPVRWRA
jgi:hypothetical protein